MRLDLVTHEGQRRFTDWSNVPYANRNGSEFNLNSNDADNANPNWASPVVRDYSIEISASLPACVRSLII